MEPTNPIDRRTLLGTTGALVGAGLLGFGSAGVAASEHTDGLEPRSEPRYELGEPEPLRIDVEFDNADGETESVTLYGEVIRPVDPCSCDDPIDDVPVILTYSPYNDLYVVLNDGDSPARDGIAEYFVPRGYARAQFDLIGTRNSGGYYDYGGVRERKSGAELVDALGELPWTNGNVGMIGGSYDGTTQYAAAVEAPEHLKAIVPQVAIDRWYDYKHHGGVPYNLTGGGGGTPYLFDFGFAAIPPSATDAPADSIEATTTRLEPGGRVEHTVRSTEYDSDYDEFWEERDYRIRADDVGEHTAVLIEGGWEDRNVKRIGSTRFFEALAADHPKWMVIGDWGHEAAQFAEAMAFRHAFFDRFLFGHDTGFESMPAVDTKSASSPRTQYDDWPPATAETVALPLVTDDPTAGELELLGTAMSSFEDRSPPITEDEMFDERASGDRYLLFETPPLAEPARIAGRVTADLEVASEGETWFTAVVYDRTPDGSVEFVARGFWDAKRRNGVRKVDDVPTARTYRVPVECWDIDWTVETGHRLGVAIAADNEEWVRHDPRNQGTNQVILEGSSLRIDLVEGRDALGDRVFPTAALDRDGDASALTGGQVTRVDVTVDADRPVRVRDRLPEGWNVAGGEARQTTTDDAQFAVFEEPVEPGETRTYFVEAPGDLDSTGSHEFGPFEYGVDGVWATAVGTDETKVVVGIDTNVL